MRKEKITRLCNSEVILMKEWRFKILCGKRKLSRFRLITRDEDSWKYVASLGKQICYEKNHETDIERAFD